MSETPSQSYEAPKKRGIVDIVFLIDATGSMQPCINAVKDNIHSFIGNLTNPNANGGVLLKDWRASICAYRDYKCDGDGKIVINPFTTAPDELKAQLDNIVADGGGDEPESLLDALYDVINIGRTEKGAQAVPNKWRYPSDAARCIVVFTDASFHPTLEQIPGASIDDIKNLIAQERIRLSLFAPEMECHYELTETDKSVYEVIEVPEISTPASAVKEFVRNKDHFTKTLEMLAKSISQSSTEFNEL